MELIVPSSSRHSCNPANLRHLVGVVVVVSPGAALTATTTVIVAATGVAVSALLRIAPLGVSTVSAGSDSGEYSLLEGVGAQSSNHSSCNSGQNATVADLTSDKPTSKSTECTVADTLVRQVEAITYTGPSATARTRA